MGASKETKGARAVRKLTRPLPPGIAGAVNQLYFELEVWTNNLRGTRKARAYHGRHGLKLHLGSGTNYKEGWVNVDLSGDVDLALDLRRSLPLPDSSCRIIFSEHVLEHFEHPEPAGTLVAECYRLLEPGGMLSLAVPDGEMVLKAYVLGESDEYWRILKGTATHGETTHMELLNYQFRQDGQHRFYYDFETLAKLLMTKGFVNVRRREFDPATDTPSRKFGSLYVAAEKPLS